jgi:hypothetical protein
MGAYRQAFQQLAPGAKISFSGPESYETVHWKSKDITKPSKSDIEALVTELKPAWDKWEADRKAAYPSVEDQLDMIWHALERGEHFLRGSRWHDTISKIKANTPKPE